VRQLEHEGVAKRRDRGGASAVGEESDLADRRAAANLCHVPSIDIDGEAARDDKIECVGAVALAHKDLAAAHRKGDQPLFEIGKLSRRKIAKRLDERKR
jgi:hypothetical protein